MGIAQAMPADFSSLIFQIVKRVFIGGFHQHGDAAGAGEKSENVKRQREKNVTHDLSPLRGQNHGCGGGEW
jgi:hypothetical protein